MGFEKICCYRSGDENVCKTWKIFLVGDFFQKMQLCKKFTNKQLLFNPQNFRYKFQPWDELLK